jgi:GNAT superfamily N-acetyltransferase
MGIEISPPAILSRDHDLTEFDCGNLPLNNWLKRFAWQNQKANAANTFVVCVGNRVIGFYSLAVGAVEPIEAPQRLKKGLARHPIPIMVLARLAVHKEYQGLKIGSDLLKDAIVRTLKVLKMQVSRLYWYMRKMKRPVNFIAGSISNRGPLLP